MRIVIDNIDSVSFPSPTFDTPRNRFCDALVLDVIRHIYILSIYILHIYISILLLWCGLQCYLIDIRRDVVRSARFYIYYIYYSAVCSKDSTGSHFLTRSLISLASSFLRGSRIRYSKLRKIMHSSERKSWTSAIFHLGSFILSTINILNHLINNVSETYFSSDKLIINYYRSTEYFYFLIGSFILQMIIPSSKKSLFRWTKMRN